MQEQAKDLSSQSRRIIAKGSDHYVQMDRSELVNKEVTDFVLHLRDHQFPTQENHTTVEE